MFSTAVKGGNVSGYAGGLGAVGAISGGGGGIGGVSGLPGFGTGGFWSGGFAGGYNGTGYKNATEAAMGRRMGYPIKGGGASRSQLLGLTASTAMATQAGGGLGTATGLMSGAGSAIMAAQTMGMFGAGTAATAATATTAATAGGMMGLGMLIPGIGLALMVGAIIMSSMQEAPSWSREENKEQTTQIASRIDVTNKELQWVNRNLVAMRQELTYIMQRSYYFSEQDVTDKFAISASQGRM